MKKGIYTVCMAAVLLLLSVLPASADTGPKPSVELHFTDLPEDVFYVTLLSSTDSYGPYSVYDIAASDSYWTECAAEDGADINVFMKFAEYEDANGYYFLQMLDKVGSGETYSWTYYPPDPFKVLLYFPSADTFAVSEITERYVFHSVYEVSVSGGTASVRKDWALAGMLAGFLPRLVLCFAVELLIAVPFGYRKKKPLRVILLTNAVTQIVLNAALNGILLLYGSQMAKIYFVIFEIVVFIVEAAVYAGTLEKYTEREQNKTLPVLYALTANAASLTAGFLLMRYL